MLLSPGGALRTNSLQQDRGSQEGKPSGPEACSALIMCHMGATPHSPDCGGVTVTRRGEQSRESGAKASNETRVTLRTWTWTWTWAGNEPVEGGKKAPPPVTWRCLVADRQCFFFVVLSWTQRALRVRVAVTCQVWTLRRRPKRLKIKMGLWVSAPRAWQTA